MTPDTITAIASVLAGAASFGLALALRALARERRHANAYRQAARDSHTVAERWRAEAMSLRTPARDGSNGTASMARALRKITGPVKRTSARTPSTSRNDSTDTMNAMVMGSLLAPGGWSAPAPDTSSCDTSSSSSSSDGGSCGGGE